MMKAAPPNARAVIVVVLIKSYRINIYMIQLENYLTLVISIPIASLNLSTISPSGANAFLIFVFTILFDSNIQILGGLFQTSILYQIFYLILGSFSFQESNTLLSFILSFQGYLLATVPVIVYSNAETDRSQILSDNKDKAGIYQWTHIESGKIYIGSAFDLSKRLKNYFNKSYLNRSKTIYIYNAILAHGHSAFTLFILEYIDISNLSKEDARKLILEREQYYLDKMFLTEPKPESYNLLKTAGSLLGYKHSPESLAKFTGENHPMFGKTGEKCPNFGKCHSAETKTNISEAMKGEKNPNFGISLPLETRILISKAMSGENHPFFGKTHLPESISKMSEAKKGKQQSPEHRAKLSAAQGTTIFVYDTNGTLVNTFSSAREAAKHLETFHSTITRYTKNGKILQEKWILSTSLINKE